jgi:uncharacterized protein (TIGR03790 family)
VKLPVAAIVGAVLFWLVSARAFAGGGPQNVLLLVNSNSEASQTIANHYIRLRHIPASNVVYLDWKGSPGTESAIIFRDNILVPAFVAIENRRLAPQIDYIIYSSDFPWRIDLRPLFPKQQFRPEFQPSASINGATYLAEFIFAQSPAVVSPDANRYIPGPVDPNLGNCKSLAGVPTRGFRSRYTWDKNGKKTNDPQQGPHYFLSTMLGVTRARGNTVEEVVNYLQRSAQADGNPPRGTIYFMWNRDVRSLSRDKCYAGVAAQINAAGAHAVVQQGRLPTGAKDVAGLMIGTPDFNLVKDGIKILPGAICDNLTSEGGIMSVDAGQTPLSEFIRRGAAGASGTVVEPTSLQAKFPLASLQLHYVRGCSLAEAFYQSVSGPYQLLIIGDPLCRPWAAIPKITVGGVAAGQNVKGALSITPAGPASIGSYELYIDGRLAALAPPGNPFSLDTNRLEDGYHELRIVGVSSDPNETQGQIIVPIAVDNHNAKLDFQVSPPVSVRFDAKLKVTVRQSGAKSIVIRQNSRVLAHVQSESGDVEIPAAKLGRGPTTLQAFASGGVPTISRPVSFVVE